MQKARHDGFFLDSVRPGGDCRNAHAAFIQAASASPVDAVVRTRLPYVIVASREFGRDGATVVAVKHDKGVAQHLPFLQGFEHLADGFVECPYAGGIAVSRLRARISARRIERHDQKHRRRGILFVDLIHGILGKQLRDCAVLFHHLVVTAPVASAGAFPDLILYLARQRSVEIIKAASGRPKLRPGMAQLPLADERGSISRILQSLCQGALFSEESEPTGCNNGHGLQAVAHRVAPGQERGARL